MSRLAVARSSTASLKSSSRRKRASADQHSTGVHHHTAISSSQARSSRARTVSVSSTSSLITPDVSQNLTSSLPVPAAPPDSTDFPDPESRLSQAVQQEREESW